MADEIQRAVLVVQAKQERRDARSVLPVADDHAVAGLVVLHLHDRFTRPGLVREVGPLTDDTVEADHLEALEPLLRLRAVLALGRERERGRALLELDATLGERTIVDRLAVPEEDVEGDERRGRRRGELADPRLSGVEPQLHRVEVERTVALDHDLAVERRMRGKPFADGPQLREVAQERAAVPAPEGERAAVVLEDAAEAVPLGLVPPAVAGREVVDELRLHRRERDIGTNLSGRVHAPSLGRSSGPWSSRCPSC